MFFFRRHERDLEAAAKIGGALASGLAVLKFNQIIDYSVRFVGSGADTREMAVFGVLLVIGFVALLWGAVTPEEPRAAVEAVEAVEPAKAGADS